MSEKMYEAWHSPDAVKLCGSEVIKQKEQLGQIHPEAERVVRFFCSNPK